MYCWNVSNIYFFAISFFIFCLLLLFSSLVYLLYDLSGNSFFMFKVYMCVRKRSLQLKALTERINFLIDLYTEFVCTLGSSKAYFLRLFKNKQFFKCSGLLVLIVSLPSFALILVSLESYKPFPFPDLLRSPAY